MGKYVGEKIAGGCRIILWKSYNPEILNPKVELKTFACLRTHVETILLANILNQRENISLMKVPTNTLSVFGQTLETFLFFKNMTKIFYFQQKMSNLRKKIKILLFK